MKDFGNLIPDASDNVCVKSLSAISDHKVFSSGLKTCDQILIISPTICDSVLSSVIEFGLGS